MAKSPLLQLSLHWIGYISFFLIKFWAFHILKPKKIVISQKFQHESINNPEENEYRPLRACIKKKRTPRKQKKRTKDKVKTRRVQRPLNNEIRQEKCLSTCMMVPDSNAEEPH